MKEFINSVKFFFKYRIFEYSAIVFFSGLFLVFFAIVTFLNVNDPEFSWHDILVEANGFVLDILILGLGFSIFEYIRNRRDKIRRLKSEIDAYRYHESSEATVTTMANYHDLVDLGIRNYDFHGCYLPKGDFSDSNLSGSNFAFAKMQEAHLTRSNLSDVRFMGAHLQDIYFTKTILLRTDFRTADLSNCKFTSVNIRECNFSGANLNDASLIDCIIFNSDLRNVKLENAVVDLEDWIDQLDIQGNRGVDEIRKKYFVDIKSKRSPDGFPIYTIRKMRAKRKKLKKAKK